MNATDMKRYICATFDGVNALDASGDTFLIYDPDRDLPAERQLPFATIVTGDRYDSVSQLDRPEVYRLNIGLTKATYTALFGAPPTHRDEYGVLRTDLDYAATDVVMRHPIYASQYWVCVLNPAGASLDAVEKLLAEAHGFAARKYANQQTRRTPSDGSR